MTLFSLLDLVRVFGAFLFVFFVTPLLGAGYRVWRGEPFNAHLRIWISILIQEFIAVSFALEVMGILLGHVKFCLPGVLISGCLLWCLRGLWIGLRKRDLLGAKGFQIVWKTIFTYLEKDKSRLAQQPRRPSALRAHLRSAQAIAWMSMLLLLTVVQIWTPLRQSHFDRQETYVRSVSLAALSQGEKWDGNASVAFLAPLVSFSGLGAAAVIRYTGPILAIVLVLMAAVCIWRLWNGATSLLLITFVLAGASIAVGSPNWEMLPGSIAMIYGLAAAFTWTDSPHYGMLAALTAVMVSQGDYLPLLFCGLIGSGLYLVCRLLTPGILRASAAVTITAIAAYATVLGERGKAATPAYHYEAAARTCEAIGRSFHRNEWLIVSPFQELACTYGQGWHVELSDLVSRYTADQVSDPSFSFPYDLPDVFFFIERKPIGMAPRAKGMQTSWHYAPADSPDWSAFLYGSPIGRASMEYQAAELLAAYSQTHTNVSVLYQDDDLVVYHLTRSTSGPRKIAALLKHEGRCDASPNSNC